MAKSEIIRIYQDRAKMLGLLLLGGIFFGACFVAFLQEAGAGKMPPFKENLFWIAFGIMAVLMLFFAIKLLDGRPVMEFSSEGLRATEIAADIIPWQAIQSAGIRSYRRTKFLELRIDPELLLKHRPNVLRSKLRFANRAFGFPHHLITVSMLDHDADYLLELLNAHLQAQRERR